MKDTAKPESQPETADDIAGGAGEAATKEAIAPDVAIARQTASGELASKDTCTPDALGVNCRRRCDEALLWVLVLNILPSIALRTRGLPLQPRGLAFPFCAIQANKSIKSQAQTSISEVFMLIFQGIYSTLKGLWQYCFFGTLDDCRSTSTDATFHRNSNATSTYSAVQHWESRQRPDRDIVGRTCLNRSGHL